MSGSTLAAGALCAALAGLLGAGCGGDIKLHGSGPYGAGDLQPEGARYYLPRTLVQVKAKVNLVAKKKVTYRKVKDAGPGQPALYEFEVIPQEFKIESSEATATTSYVADTSQYYMIRLEPGSTSEDKLTIEAYDSGLLKSINMESVGKEGEITANTLKAGATVAAFALLLGAEDKQEADPARKLVCKAFEDDQAAPAAAPADTGARQPKQAAAAAPARKPRSAAPAGGSSAESICRSLQGLSMPVLYFLAQTADARQLYRRGHGLDATITKRRADRDELDELIRTATDKELDVLKARRALLEARVQSAQEERKEVGSTFEARLQAFLKDQNATPETVTREMVASFAPEEIPDAGTLRDGMSTDQVVTALKGHPRMLELWNASHIAMALDLGSADPAKIAAAPATRSSCSGPGDAGAEASSRIFYRPALNGRLTMFVEGKVAGTGGEARSGLRITDTQSIAVMDPRVPTACISFEPAAFSARKLALGFDDRGRLVKLEQSSTAALAGATEAAAKGLASARDELAASLTKVAEIQETKRRIELADTVTEIERLKKEKDLVDARLALAGTEATGDLLLEKQRLEAEISALEARSKLATTQATAATKEEVAKLQQQLALLEQQIALLKKQLELEQTRRDGER